MTRSLRLLILDEDANKVKQFAASLSADGVVVYSTTDPDEACQLISLLQHDVMLIGVEKLIGTPVYPLQAFRQAKPDLRIVGISCGQRGDTGLLLDMLDLDAYVREPMTPEALIIALPDIADRYLMVTAKNQPQPSPNNSIRQKWPRNLLPFVGGQQTSPPQA
jgi:DNA-binding response OmpR family regulator